VCFVSNSSSGKSREDKPRARLSFHANIKKPRHPKKKKKMEKLKTRTASPLCPAPNIRFTVCPLYAHRTIPATPATRDFVVIRDANDEDEEDEEAGGLETRWSSPW